MTIPNWREKLRHFRKKMGTTQVELSRLLNTSQQTIVNWEKEGGTNPSIDDLYRITKILGITMNDLFADGESQEEAAEKTRTRVRLYNPSGYEVSPEELKDFMEKMEAEISDIKKQINSKQDGKKRQ